jgi:hypothetical protein
MIAAHADIAIIAPSTTAQAQKFAQMLEVSLKDTSVPEQVDLLDTNTETNLEKYRLIITLSGTTLRQLIADNRLPDNIPVVASYLSKAEHRQYRSYITSAIYSEAPLQRQLALAEAIFGESEIFGALVAKDASALVSADNLRVYPIAEYESLNHALVELLGSSKALIGVYDPELYSAENIKSILITSYRHNRPLIGPTQAYLKAGALASTYSTPEDVVRRLSEVVTEGLGEQGVFPASDYNPYFSVGFNRQVGRSLNLLLPDPADVAERIRAQEVIR